MEYWSVDKKSINPLAVTSTLQYSNTPKLIQIETSHDGLPSFELYVRNKLKPQPAELTRIRIVLYLFL